MTNKSFKIGQKVVRKKGAGYEGIPEGFIGTIVEIPEDNDYMLKVDVGEPDPYYWNIRYCHIDSKLHKVLS